MTGRLPSGPSSPGSALPHAGVQPGCAPVRAVPHFVLPAAGAQTWAPHPLQRHGPLKTGASPTVMGPVVPEGRCGLGLTLAWDTPTGP